MFAIHEQLVRDHVEQLIRDAHRASEATRAARVAWTARTARTSLPQRVVHHPV